MTANDHGDPSGLHLLKHLGREARATDEHERMVLGALVSALVSRGWLQPLPKTLDAITQALDEPEAKVNAAMAKLQERGLVTVDGERITTVAGLLATKATRVRWVIGSETNVALTGPLAALGAPVALQRSGHVHTSCHNEACKAEIRLDVDSEGIVERHPSSACAFLLSWAEGTPIDIGAAGGGLFCSDDCLEKWQQSAGEPDGMPIPSFLFPNAAAELGAELGEALKLALAQPHHD